MRGPGQILLPVDEPLCIFRRVLALLYRYAVDLGHPGANQWRVIGRVYTASFEDPGHRVDLAALNVDQEMIGRVLVERTAPVGIERLDKWKRGNRRILGNASASLWDIGDRVVCLEFHSKMNALDQGTLEIAAKSVQTVHRGDYAGMVIYNDAENFSVGANAGHTDIPR